MKKKTLLATAAAGLMAVTLAFGFAGCSDGKGADALVEKAQVPTFASKELTAIGGYSILTNSNKNGQYYEIDDEGVVMLQKIVDTAYEYAIYDIATGTLQTSPYKIYMLDDGVYYTIDENVENPVTTYTYDVYSATQKLRTVTQDEAATIKGGVMYFADGTVLYKSLAGKIVTDRKEDPMEIIPTAQNTEKVGNYYVLPIGEGNGFIIYNKSGKQVRTVGYTSALDIATPDDMMGWAIYDTSYLQCTYAEPDNSSDYDVIMAGQKYSVENYSFNLISGKFSKIKGFDYVVTDQVEQGDDYAVLKVNEIVKGKRLSVQTIVQAFGKDGKVFADLQKLLPGANSFSVSGEYFKLSNGIQTNYYTSGGKLAVSLTGEESVSWYGDGLLWNGGDTFYTSKGEVFYELPDGASLIRADSEKIYYTHRGEGATENTLYIFDAETGATSNQIYGGEVSGFYLVKGDGVYSLYDFEYGNAVFENIALANGVSSVDVGVYTSTEKSDLVIITAQKADSAVHYLVRYDYKKARDLTNLNF